MNYIIAVSEVVIEIESGRVNGSMSKRAFGACSLFLDLLQKL